MSFGTSTRVAFALTLALFSGCGGTEEARRECVAETCDGLDNDCDGSIDERMAREYYPDQDGDGFGNPDVATAACQAPAGFVADARDCDDSNAEIFPGAPEVCDQIDNDCDGRVDRDDSGLDLSTRGVFYADDDLDGYGDPASGIERCSAPEGYVDNDKDCDDADPEKTPESLWFRDEDLDGFGAEGMVVESCDAPDGYTAVAGDCNDLAADVSPAAIEYCDGIDNNCDSETDEVTSVDVTTWYSDFDGDGYGIDSVTVVACDQPSLYSEVAGDCDDGNATVYPDAFESCDGLDNDCDGATDYTDSIWVPGDYNTIQGALDSMVDGEVLCVSAGTYSGPLDFGGKSVLVAGSGVGATTLDADGAQLTLLNSGEEITLGGLSIQNAWTAAGGSVAEVDASSLSLMAVGITDSGCSGTTTCAGGILKVSDGVLELKHILLDTLYMEQAGDVDGGVVYAEGSDLTLEDVTMKDSYVASWDRFSDLSGGFLYDSNCTLQVDDLTVIDSTFLGWDRIRGGLAYSDEQMGSWSNVVFGRNSVWSEGYDYSSIRSVFIDLNGGGSSVTWTGLALSDNEAVASRSLFGGFFCSDCGEHEFANVLVSDNSFETTSRVSGSSYGLWLIDSGKISMTNLDMVYNDFANFSSVYSVLGQARTYQSFEARNANIVGNSASNVDTTFAGIFFSSNSAAGEFSYINEYDNWSDYAYGSSLYQFNGQDVTATVGYQAADPLYTDPTSGDYSLRWGSPAIDAGNPDPEYNDVDGTANDLGAFGGPLADY